LFEALNLIETHQIKAIPIVLVGGGYWRRVINLQYLVDEGLIDEEDRDLVQVVETGEAAAQIVLAAHSPAYG
jgi:predicted Rossmann-fold nucleotide-binding protein